MKRAFRFRLARVARAREILEEAARAEFAAAQNHANALHARAAEIEAAIAGGHASQATLQGTSGALDIGALLSRDRSIAALEVKLVRARHAAAEADRAAEEQRALWQVKKQATSALEQLKNRHREEHRIAVQRAENAEMDEIAGRRFQFATDPDFRESGV